MIMFSLIIIKVGSDYTSKQRLAFGLFMMCVAFVGFACTDELDDAKTVSIISLSVRVVQGFAQACINTTAC